MDGHLNEFIMSYLKAQITGTLNQDPVADMD